MYVTFQPKAWADRAWCLSWVASEFKRITDEFVDKSRRALAIYDNLDGQSNPEFKKVSATTARADTHFGLGGATDYWQVVDDGIGHMLKKEMAEYLDEKLEEEAFYEEFIEGVMSTSRVRVLTTELAATAWDRICARLDVEQIFKNKGWAMTTGNANDDLKIARLPNYTWKSEEVDTESECEEEDEVSDNAIEEEGEELLEPGDDSEGDESDSSGESSAEEEVDPGSWEDTDEWQAQPYERDPKAKDTIAHKFLTETGWEVGTIKKKSGGFYQVKYPDGLIWKHKLAKCDCGPDKAWLFVKQL